MLFLKQGSHMRRTILIAVLIIVACIFCFLFPIFQIIEKALSQMNLLFMWVAKIRRLSILSKVAE